MSPTTSTVTHDRPASFPSPRWWISDRDGRVVLAQPPNPALAAWMVSVAIGWTGLLDDRRQVVLERVGQGALVAWSLDEVVRGATPVRRLLGAVVLVVVLWRLFG